MRKSARKFLLKNKLSILLVLKIVAITFIYSAHSRPEKKIITIKRNIKKSDYKKYAGTAPICILLGPQEMMLVII